MVNIESESRETTAWVASASLISAIIGSHECPMCSILTFDKKRMFSDNIQLPVPAIRPVCSNDSVLRSISKVVNHISALQALPVASASVK